MEVMSLRVQVQEALVFSLSVFTLSHIHSHTRTLTHIRFRLFSSDKHADQKNKYFYTENNKYKTFLSGSVQQVFFFFLQTKQEQETEQSQQKYLVCLFMTLYTDTQDSVGTM